MKALCMYHNRTLKQIFTVKLFTSFVTLLASGLRTWANLGFGDRVSQEKNRKVCDCSEEPSPEPSLMAWIVPIPVLVTFLDAALQLMMNSLFRLKSETLQNSLED